MWPDPFLKRKPHSLGGTPANKYIFKFCVSIVAAFAIGINLLAYTPYFKKKIANVEQGAIQTQEDRKIKEFLSDPLVKGALARKRKEYDEEDPLAMY